MKKGCVLWFYGLSGSGKSTLAHELNIVLAALGVNSYVLDGDNIRTGLNKDLGLSEADRKENIRRAAEVAKLMADSGLIVIAAFITPYEESRQQAREIANPYELFIDCPIEICQKRDPKNLYKTRNDMTGISAPFDYPASYHLKIQTHKDDIDTCLFKILGFMKQKNMLTANQ
jgi:adenylyl-sulfate kinase